MGEDYTVDDDETALIEMLSSPSADVRERGWRIVLWRYGLPLKKYILALLYTRHLPGEYWEDMVQKTYSTATELFSTAGYKGQPFYPWLCSIARNHIGNFYRQEQVLSRRTLSLDLSESQIEESFYASDSLNSTSPEDVLLNKLQHQARTDAFQQAQKQLTVDEHRLLNALLDHSEWSLQELAQHLRENPKTLRNKKSLLIKKLNLWIEHFQQQISGGDSDE